MWLSSSLGVTVVWREPAKGDDLDPLLVSLLAKRLSSKLSRSASARSPKILLQLGASLEEGSWPGWAENSGKGRFGG